MYHQNEVEQSKYNFECSDAAMHLHAFSAYEAECKKMCEERLLWPAYDYCLSAPTPSTCLMPALFPLLNARAILAVYVPLLPLWHIFTRNAELGYPIKK